MAFELLIDKRAEREIEVAIDYLSQSQGVIKKLLLRIEAAYKLLSENPFNQIRYDKIRCLPIKGFPYMFHYSTDEKTKTVYIHGFIHTSQNPDEHWIIK